MIIIAGEIYVKPGQRDSFITRSCDAIVAARQISGCMSFAVSPDPIDENRVNIYEKWNSEEELHAFRGAGPDDDLSYLIDSININEYRVADIE